MTFLVFVNSSPDYPHPVFLKLPGTKRSQFFHTYIQPHNNLYLFHAVIPSLYSLSGRMNARPARGTGYGPL